MRIDEIILIAVTESGKRDRGRTRLQKVCYFLCERLKIDARYSPYYYGPYSETVARAAESLIARGVLEEEIESVDSAGPFEGRLYSYELTASGRELVESIRANRPEEYQAAASNARKLLASNPSTKALAIASKLHIVVKGSGKPVREADLSKHAARLGWEILDTDIGEAKQFLRDQGLITVTSGG